MRCRRPHVDALLPWENTAMMIRLIAALAVGTIAFIQVGSPQSGQKDAQPAAAVGDKTAFEAFFKDYANAFNRKDAKALAAMWAAGATYVNRDDGDRSEGRAAIEADLAASFKARPNARLTGGVDRVRYIRPDVVHVEGRTETATPDEDVDVDSFSAIFVKEDGRWVIDSLEESSVSAEGGRSALRDLDWLIGHWVDQTEGIAVESNVRWSANQAFLIRSYSIKGDGGVGDEGTQIIGWDPRAKRIRSWDFDQDGSFGEGVWSKNGDEWLIKSNRTTADGGSASGTYVFKPTGRDSMTVQLIGAELDGEPMPNQPAVVVARTSQRPAAEREQIKQHTP
jgi:uncharacterized protein (TIGR02246 family)